VSIVAAVFYRIARIGGRGRITDGIEVVKPRAQAAAA